MVTGGARFLGTDVVEELRRRGYANASVVRSRDHDLTTHRGVTSTMTEYEPEVIIHLAAIVWGDSSPTREFLYVADAARAISDATERYSGSQPVNLGSSFEISIRDPATEVTTVVGYTGEILWDTTKSKGQHGPSWTRVALRSCSASALPMGSPKVSSTLRRWEKAGILQPFRSALAGWSTTR
jgi:nucleoside-diphosphate-sugar epimerase